nr:hypothetical protein [Clostridia bacterium]
MFIEFDGVIEVSVDEEGCEYIHLNMTANDEKAARIQQMYVNLCPLGIDEHYGLNISPDTALGYDYYLTVNTQTLLGKPMVKAHLKLSTLPDPYYPQEETYSEKYSRYPPDVVRTRLMSVELLSYEYSDVYLMDNDMVGDEE